MTILQLISSEGFYGAESMLVTLAQALSRLGCDLTVGVFNDSRAPHTEVGETARQAGLATKMVPCRGRWDWKALQTIRAMLDESPIDVLHTHGYKADLYGYAASWSRPVVRVSTCHNWPNPLWRMQAYAALNRLVLRSFDEVTTPSPNVAETLERSGVAPRRLSWIRNGVDVNRFRGASATLRNELAAGARRIVGFVGRLVAGKGGATLLEAAREVLAIDRNCLFVFVGDGPSRQEWQALALRLGIGSNVVFTGARHDMAGVYASFDIFVLPSYDEAMPMSVLEAMSAAKPVIATRVGAVPELVVPDETGLLCATRDAGGLSQAILTLLRDEDLARRMGENGYTRALQGFSSDFMARKYLRLYEKALGERKTRPADSAIWSNGQ
jgi:glycosyltransferase involved in cell wall biosynthesis